MSSLENSMRVFLAAVALLCAVPVTAQQPVVVIDPGHGGDVAGVVAGGVEEKGVVLRMAYAVAAEFVRRGYDVRLTRTGDEGPSGQARRTLAEQVGGVLFISLHTNGDEDTTKFGVEIYTNPVNTQSRAAAEHVAQSLRGMGTPVVIEDRGWGFLASPSVPTVMIEAGFLTNPVERRVLLTQGYLHRLAEHIAAGADIFLDLGH